MTCEESRELFSARVDDVVSADERARLDAHLATCAECTREWERFAGTVGMLRAVAPARAPAGFVDRVVAVRLRPWYWRLVRGLFTPWPVKLPLEVAALVLIAGLAVLLLQRSPDSVPSSDSLRDAPSPADSGRPAVEPPRQPHAETPEPRERREAHEPREHPPGRQAEPSTPAAATRKSGEVQALRAGPAVQARLAVVDSARAERAVRDLVIRTGGDIVARIDEPDVLVLHLVVPGERWNEVRQGLQTLGALRLEGEPGSPADPVRVTLRLEG